MQAKGLQIFSTIEHRGINHISWWSLLLNKQANKQAEGSTWKLRSLQHTDHFILGFPHHPPPKKTKTKTKKNPNPLIFGSLTIVLIFLTWMTKKAMGSNCLKTWQWSAAALWKRAPRSFNSTHETALPPLGHQLLGEPCKSTMLNSAGTHQHCSLHNPFSSSYWSLTIQVILTLIRSFG